MKINELDETGKCGFSVKSAENIIFRSLTDIAAEVSRVRFAVSAEDIEELAKARRIALSTVEAHFDNMERVVHARRENITRFSHINFVSLGFDCLPRTLLTRWGLKRSAKLGEISMPFDLAFHSAEGVAAIIEGDFDFYFNGPLVYDAKQKFAVYPPFGVELNHDVGDEFYADGWAGLHARYQARAANFRAMLASEQPAMFVHHTHDRSVDRHIRALFDLVRRLRAGRPTGFACVHTPDFKAPGGPPLPSNEIRLIERSYPFDGYTWHNQRHTFSRRGFDFERSIAEELAAIVEGFGWDRDGTVARPAQADSPRHLVASPYG